MGDLASVENTIILSIKFGYLDIQNLMPFEQTHVCKFKLSISIPSNLQSAL